MLRFLKGKFWHPRDVITSGDGFTFTTLRVPILRKVANALSERRAAVRTAFVWAVLLFVTIAVTIVWNAGV